MPGNEQGGGKIYDRLFNEAEQRRRELAAEVRILFILLYVYVYVLFIYVQELISMLLLH